MFHLFEWQTHFRIDVNKRFDEWYQEIGSLLNDGHDILSRRKKKKQKKHQQQQQQKP